MLPRTMLRVVITLSTSITLLPQGLIMRRFIFCVMG